MFPTGDSDLTSTFMLKSDSSYLIYILTNFNGDKINNHLLNMYLSPN